MAQQLIWTGRGSQTRRLSLFANFDQADDRIAEIQQIAEGRLSLIGVTTSRPQDDLGAAIGRPHVNGLIADGANLYNSQLPTPSGPGAKPVPRNEYPAESHCTINAAPAIAVRRNV